MRKLCTITAAATLIAIASAPALAQTGNGAPSGGHYSLNIIGVEKGKKATMTGSERHTIFVALGKSGNVTTNIYLEPRWEFQVCDGNGFDAAHGCDGSALGGGKIGAVFALPCNTNISQSGTIDPDGPDGPLGPTPIETLNCDELDDDLIASYTVWARALGQPGGSATITTCATEVGDTDGDGIAGEEICSLENVLLTRGTGKSTFANVTNELTSLVACFNADADTDIECFRYALFRNEFSDWLWQYDNNGLRLAQLRFYPVEED